MFNTPNNLTNSQDHPRGIYADISWAKRVSSKEQLDNLFFALGKSPPINPNANYANQIYLILYNAILQGKLLPGMAISETVAVSFFNVSRTPIREAFQRLALADLIWIFPQNITIIAPVRKSKIIEGAFVRHSLEGENLRELTPNINSEQLKELAQILAIQKTAVDNNNFALFNEYDDIFHKTLLRFSQRENIWEYIIPIKVPLDRVRWLLISNVPKHISLAYKQHLEVFNFLKKHDTKKVVQAINEHIYAINQHFQNIKKVDISKLIID